jgi:hypothetical protein
MLTIQPIHLVACPFVSTHHTARPLGRLVACHCVSPSCVSPDSTMTVVTSVQLATPLTRLVACHCMPTHLARCQIFGDMVKKTADFLEAAKKIDEPIDRLLCDVLSASNLAEICHREGVNVFQPDAWGHRPEANPRSLEQTALLFVAHKQVQAFIPPNHSLYICHFFFFCFVGNALSLGQ